MQILLIITIAVIFKSDLYHLFLKESKNAKGVVLWGFVLTQVTKLLLKKNKYTHIYTHDVTRFLSKC